ncbi:MAG: hypothetical protein V4568_11590 [Pseudomonadota bacterium]
MRSTNVDIELVLRSEFDPPSIRVFSEKWECVLRLELFSVEDDFDFRFIYVSGVTIKIKIGGRIESSLEEFFTQCPPIIWFADGSSLEGCEFTKLPSDELLPYDPERLEVVDWSGVDISSESQGENKRAGTIQHKIIEMLQQNPSYSIIFDDDGTGEAADVVAISVVDKDQRRSVEVELYHLKYTSSQPGGRVDDLYVVCGQAQRSTCWLVNYGRRIELFTHLLRRNELRTAKGRGSRFERGDIETLLQIRETSRRTEVRFKVFVVQPGLSKTAASASQLTLLAVTERYLSDTYEIPFSVMCSA